MSAPFDKAIGVPQLISPSRWPRQAKRLGQGKLGVNLGGGDLGVAGVFNFPWWEQFVFEGDTVLQSTPSNLGIVADGGKLAFSFMYQPPPSYSGGTDGVSKTILSSNTRRVVVSRNVANQIQLFVENATVTSTLTVKTSQTFITGAPAVHIDFYVDTNQATGAKVGVVAINGVVDASATVTEGGTGAAFLMDLTDTNWLIGANTTALGSPLTGQDSVGELMMWAGQTIDWTNAAQRAKTFDTVLGIPVDPGADGSLVTGTAPQLYLSIRSKGTAASFLTNRGSGGNAFTTTGVALKNQRQLLERGTSRTAGTGASNGSKAVSRLVARGFTPPRVDFNRGQGGWNYGPGQSQIGIANLLDNEFDANCAIIYDRIWRTEGSVNGIHPPSIAVEIAAIKQSRDRIRLHDKTIKHYHVGICNGGQAEDNANTGLPNGTFQADDEEFAALGHFWDSTYAGNGPQYNNILKINQPAAAYIGIDFFDLNRAYVTGYSSVTGAFQAGGADIDINDPTIDPLDGYPVGIVPLMAALALAFGFDITTYATPAAGMPAGQDAYNLAHCVRPMSSCLLGTVPHVTARTARFYGVHSNDFGHKIEAVLELRFLQWRGWLAL